MPEATPHGNLAGSSVNHHMFTKEQHIKHARFVRDYRMMKGLTATSVARRWINLPGRLTSGMGSQASYSRFEKGGKFHFCACTAIDLARVFNTSVYDILPADSPLVVVFRELFSATAEQDMFQERRSMASLAREYPEAPSFLMALANSCSVAQERHASVAGTRS